MAIKRLSVVSPTLRLPSLNTCDHSIIISGRQEVLLLVMIFCVRRGLNVDCTVFFDLTPPPVAAPLVVTEAASFASSHVGLTSFVVRLQGPGVDVVSFCF